MARRTTKAPAVEQLSLFGSWGTPHEMEIMRRIQVAAWAYAYEVEDDPLVSDAKYDEVARLIKPQMITGRPALDKFFREEFAPHTGAWVRRHPELIKLIRVVRIMRERAKRGT